jgi:hypothetical protein
LPVDEFLLQCGKLLVIQLKFDLQRTVSHAALALKQLSRLVDDFIKFHSHASFFALPGGGMLVPRLQR